MTQYGYSYGTPLVVKTKKWVDCRPFFRYDNDNGQGYFYLVNPKDGSLYETIATGAVRRPIPWLDPGHRSDYQSG